MKSKDLLNAIEKTTASTLEWLRAIKNYVKYANQHQAYFFYSTEIRMSG